MLTLDGSTLEGGGQLIRVALSLSAICNIPITIHSIRANRAKRGQINRQTKGQDRTKRNNVKDAQRREVSSHSGKSESAGGLKESHLAALNWLATQCDAEVDGAQIGSTEITFVPHAKKHFNGKDALRIGVDQLHDLAKNTICLNNPGSVWLIFQALYPYIVFNSHRFAPSSDSLTLHLHGGTHVPKSMSTHYLTQVFQPMCQRIGLPQFTITTHSHGWAGSASAIGHVEITYPLAHSKRESRPTDSQPPFSLGPFALVNRGTITKVSVSILANPEAIRNFIQESLSILIPKHLALPDLPIEFTETSASGDPRRLYILLAAHTSNGYILGRDFLGSGRNPKNTKEAERIAEQACESVVRHLAREIRHGGCVDEFMADQLVVFQALANGRSEVHGTATASSSADLQKLEARTAHLTVSAGTDEEDDMSGDDTGSLHARTVRWVAETMLRPRHLSSANARCARQNVEFRAGGVCDGVGWNA